MTSENRKKCKQMPDTSASALMYRYLIVGVGCPSKTKMGLQMLLQLMEGVLDNTPVSSYYFPINNVNSTLQHSQKL
jgi:hypothetical protein